MTTHIYENKVFLCLQNPFYSFLFKQKATASHPIVVIYLSLQRIAICINFQEVLLLIEGPFYNVMKKQQIDWLQGPFFFSMPNHKMQREISGWRKEWYIFYIRI